MSNWAQDRLQQVKSTFADLFQQIVSHPRSEEIYNRWCQLSPKDRKNVILATKATFAFVMLFVIVYGSYRLAVNQWDLWKGQELLSQMINYKIRSQKIDGERQHLAQTKGAEIFSDTIQNLLSPIYAEAQMPASVVHITPQADGNLESTIVKKFGVNIDRMTVLQLVKVLYQIQMKGANLLAQNVNMTLIERGWYRVSFEISQTLPKGG